MLGPHMQHPGVLVVLKRFGSPSADRRDLHRARTDRHRCGRNDRPEPGPVPGRRSRTAPSAGAATRFLSPVEFEEKHYAEQATAEAMNLKPRQPALTIRSAPPVQRGTPLGRPGPGWDRLVAVAPGLPARDPSGTSVRRQHPLQPGTTGLPRRPADDRVRDHQVERVIAAGPHMQLGRAAGPPDPVGVGDGLVA